MPTCELINLFLKKLAEGKCAHVYLQPVQNLRITITFKRRFIVLLKRCFFEKSFIFYIIAVCIAFVISGSALIAQSGKIVSLDKNAAAAIEEARNALGGENNINGIKSLVLTGTRNTHDIRTKLGTSNNFEIKILLPDNYVSAINVSKPTPGVPDSIQYRGVSNGELIYGTITGGIKTYSINTDGPNAVNIQLDDFARLLLGTILKSDPVSPITLSPLRRASNKFSVETTRGLLCEIEFDSKNKYPSVITYKEDIPAITFFGVSSEAKTVERVVRFKDRKAIDGVMFPMSIVHEYDNVVQEFKIKTVQINPKLELKDFELPEHTLAEPPRVK